MSGDWTLRDSVTEYETGWYDGGYDRFEQPDGSTKRYYWAALAPAVVVVGIVDVEEIPDDAAASGDRHVVFVEQFRPTVKESQRELVAGIVDEHEGEPSDPVDSAAYEAAAKREVAEETGYVAEDAELLESYAVATGVLRHRRGITVATGLTAGEADPDENEFLSVETVPVDDALAIAREPPTNDATLEGLLLAAEDGHL